MPDGLTTPDKRSTVAILRSLLLHVPAVAVSPNATVPPPIHNVGLPVIAAGVVFTVVVIVVLHPAPAPFEYVIVALPATVAGLITPVKRSTVVIVASLVLHVPAVAVSPNATGSPAKHNVGLPVIGCGVVFTVAVIEVLQPTPDPLV